MEGRDFAQPRLPPTSLRFMGESDDKFLAVGDEMVSDLRRRAGLEANSVVLDVGSGYGRLAHALHRTAWFDGRYVGLDILPRHVQWCQEHLADDGFSFQVMDVHNGRYHPTGHTPPTEAIFPVDRNAFDVVCFFSVFTHMWGDEVARYLGQTRRALRRGGRTYATFFLLDDSWRALQDAGVQGEYPLTHRHGEHTRIMNPEEPLHVVAFDDRWLYRTIREVGLVRTATQLGTWCGREGEGFQDAVVMRRRRLVSSAVYLAMMRLRRHG